MADFNFLDELLNTTDGMTVLRNNSKQDDGTDAVAGVGWFRFNGATASTLSVSGNSWVGFGAPSEHLKVCRRDAALYSLYRQEGTIGGDTAFLKLRWEGYATYSSTSPSESLQWELFLFDDGGMYLNLLDVPENTSYLGTSALTCGGHAYPLPVAAGEAAAYSFTPQDNAGTAWTVARDGASGEVYRLEGTALYTLTGLSPGNVANSRIFWSERTPPGTAAAVTVSLAGGPWRTAANGGPVVSPGTVLDGAALSVRVKLSTTDPSLTPAVSDLGVRLQSQEDCYSLLLRMDPKTRFASAAGGVTVTYDGSGGLEGEGGSVAAFTKTFLPEGLVPKPHQHKVERIDMNAAAAGTLLRVYYTETRSDAHVALSATAVGVLTHINDL